VHAIGFGFKIFKPVMDPFLIALGRPAIYQRKRWTQVQFSVQLNGTRSFSSAILSTGSWRNNLAAQKWVLRGH